MSSCTIPKAAASRKSSHRAKSVSLRHINAGMTFVVNDPSNIRLIKALGGGSILRRRRVTPITFFALYRRHRPQLASKRTCALTRKPGVDVAHLAHPRIPRRPHRDLVLQFSRGRGGAHALITGDQGRLVCTPPRIIPAHRAALTWSSASAESRKRDLPDWHAAFSSRPSNFFQQCLRGEETPAYMADHADGTLRVVEAAF